MGRHQTYLICIIHNCEYLWNKRRYQKKENTIFCRLKSLLHQLEFFFILHRHFNDRNGRSRILQYLYFLCYTDSSAALNQSRTSSPCSLLRRLDETSDSSKIDITRSILIGLKDNINGQKQNSKKFVGHSFESRACELNRKSAISGLQIRSFQGCSFHDRWSRGTKTLDTRVAFKWKKLQLIILACT